MALRVLGTDIPVEQIRERVGALAERVRVPHVVDAVFPRVGSSHPGLKRLGRGVWKVYDRAFPRYCRHCIHYDYQLGQDNLEGKTLESEGEAQNLVAQKLLMGDFVWDVDGEEVRIKLTDLGACSVREVYTFREGTCPRFARTPGGALDLPDAVSEAPSGVTGWRKPRKPSEAQDDEEAGRSVADPDVDAGDAEQEDSEPGGRGGAGDSGAGDQAADEGGSGSD